ncbi:MAG: sigma-70 family RNA polymerase sigma factor [Pseudomonadota bacterium]
MSERFIQNKIILGAATIDPPASQVAKTPVLKQFSLDKLYRDHIADLKYFLLKEFGAGPPDPEDIAHEAFHKLAQEVDLSRISNHKAFLWRTARNLVLTEKRNTGRRTKFDYEVEQLYFASKGPKSTPEGVLEVSQQLSAVSCAIQEMPPARRKALIWRRIECMKMETIAERLGVSRRAVSKHIERAIVDIETALEAGPKQQIDNRATDR